MFPVALFNFAELKSQFEKHKVKYYILPIHDIGSGSKISLDKYYKKNPNHFLYIILIPPSKDIIKYFDFLKITTKFIDPPKIQNILIDRLIAKHLDEKEKKTGPLYIINFFLSLFEHVGLKVFNNKVYLILNLD